MVDKFATTALETLRDLLIEEAKFLWGVDDQVQEVGRQLRTLHCFLKEADKRRHRDTSDSEIVRDLVDKLRVLSIDAENVLDRYAVQVGSGGSLTNILRRFASILCACFNVHQIGKEIKNIRSSLADLTKQAESLTQGGISSSESDHTHEWSSRRTYGHEVERYFVGMKEDIKLLESLVTSDDKSNQVISICGMGGLGKTTLATKIYQMESVQHCFEACAWICISQQFQAKIVFQGLLKQLLPKEKGQEIKEMEEEDLVRELYKVQKERKCLVVLDDIWEIDHWNSLKCAFPIGGERCRVLITSRSEKIAATEYVYKLKCLSEDEGTSKDSNSKQLFPRLIPDF